MTTGHYICSVKRKIHREDILKAGLDLMFLNGYNATGIKDITEYISIPKGSFYNHFKSKEDFGIEMVKMYCDNGVKMYEKQFLQSQLSPILRFQQFFDNLIKNYESDLNCKLGCIMSNFSTEMSDVNERFRLLLDEEFENCQLIMKKCLDEAKTNSEIKNGTDTTELAAYILNGWHGALVRMKTTGTVQPLITFKNITLNQLLQ